MLPPAKPPDPDPGDGSDSSSSHNIAPHLTTPNRHHAGPAKVTPRSTPRATTPTPAPGVPNPTGTSPRRVSTAKKIEPSLLTDFLMGRPSPARLAAQKQRRKSAMETTRAAIIAAAAAEEAAKATVRQSAVRKLQPPVAVNSRVKTWRKAHAAAMAVGDPHATPSEPTEIAFNHDDDDSVNEGDRIRIKRRRKSRSPPTRQPVFVTAGDGTEDRERLNVPPRKRIVSDDHWMKKHKKPSPGRNVKPAREVPISSPSPIPRDYPPRTANNPPVSKKIQDWARHLEVPESLTKNPVRQDRRSRPGSRQHSVGSSSAMENTRSSHNRPSATVHSNTDDSSGVVPPLSTGSNEAINLTSCPTHSHADDGIRVRPLPIDDGIRVRPIEDGGGDDSTPVCLKDRSPPAHSNSPSPARRSRATQDAEKNRTMDQTPCQATDLTKVSMKKKRRNDRPRSNEVLTSQFDRPRERAPPTRTPPRHPSPPEAKPFSKRPQMAGRGRDDAETGSWSSHDDIYLETPIHRTRSDFDAVSGLGGASLADIPVGLSAFSELNLDTGPTVTRGAVDRGKAGRSASFKAMPKVLKKVVSEVVSEGKKMIHDTVDPSYRIANQPPSIEKWLNGTVDPFVDVPPAAGRAVSSASPQRISIEKDWAAQSQARRRSSIDIQKSDAAEAAGRGANGMDEPFGDKEPRPSAEPSGEPIRTSPASVSNHMKRRKAVKSSHSPFHSPFQQGPRTFRQALRDAFKGESVVPSYLGLGLGGDPKNRQDVAENDLISYLVENRRTSRSGSPERSPDPTEKRQRSESDFVNGHALQSALEPEYVPQPHLRLGAESRSPTISTATAASPTAELNNMAGPRRRPPTNGVHELSTIVSGDSSRGYSDGVGSTVSETTVTQATVLSYATDVTRRKSQKSGLRRRLTRHSDLLSVLSLPGREVNAQPQPPLYPTMERKRSGDTALDDLVNDFCREEDLFQRELKTLVDGVVPVLLSEVIHDPSSKTHSPPNDMSAAVVNMGIALEKIKKLHKKAPGGNDGTPIFFEWLRSVVPAYGSYIAAWRLGFQDLVVNLAPRGYPEDGQDSLINALPRDENGDVLDQSGERIDVAHFLKRPLLRVKALARLIKGLDSLFGTQTSHALLQDYEALLEKARRRHKSETARMIDRDAIDTDTSQARDLMTLATTLLATIDSSRQVDAKDDFDLILIHSSGQRLECRVELVYRDNQMCADDLGDVLIREVEPGKRPRLLFPPISIANISARLGEDSQVELVVMVRGAHHGLTWHELFTLSTDSRNQVLDWLEILGTDPIPPRNFSAREVAGEHENYASVCTADVQNNGYVAEDCPATSFGRAVDMKLHPRRAGLPVIPVAVGSPPDTAPIRNSSPCSHPASSGSHSLDGVQPDRDVSGLRKGVQSTPSKEGGAPPPPIHRTPGFDQPSPPPTPPLKPSTYKRRRIRCRTTSSPLKHEYLPSQRANYSPKNFPTRSESEPSEDESGSVSEDSVDDDLDSADIPETELGISIRHEPAPLALDCSIVSASICSLTPSNSASQIGHKAELDLGGGDSITYSVSVSHWVDKRGSWKDISEVPCSITVGPGFIRAHQKGLRARAGGKDARSDGPLLTLDLTPLVLLRRSTAVDLEIRSSVQSECASHTIGGGNFRFRCPTASECLNLYVAVHHARLNNEKYIQLENEARFGRFGQPQQRFNEEDRGSGSGSGSGGGSASVGWSWSGRPRRGWFGRRNSYRAPVRDRQSQDGTSSSPSSSPSASSFLRKLAGSTNLSFNLARSSVDRSSRSGSRFTSFYATGSSSASGTPPRSPSVGMEGVGTGGGSGSINIRLHLLVTSTKWEDYGNCVLQIRRPPPGWHQELRANHGLEKRVTATVVPKNGGEGARIVLDAVLGSGCFSSMGRRGIVCGVWEELRDESGIVGVVPAKGNAAGNIKKWCFQCATASEAGWLLRLVHAEVVRA